MKKVTRFVPAVIAASVFAASINVAPASADMSANVGAVSKYYFRGIQQTDSVSVSAGLDYEADGFYAGTWVADVKDGLEVDLYAGFGTELESGMSLGAGVTTYQYTGDFDSAYNELNLSAGYSIFSLEYTFGDWESDASLGIDGGSYTFLGLTAEYEGFYGTYGTFDEGDSGSYFEVGYGGSVEDAFDYGVSFISSDADLGNDESFVLSISKSFDL
ncbi:MAG: hypothetical protein RL336_1354 [Pseudomonadota bacterium]|jgi:uncharacterized protein (TIGR02001 family)